MPDQETDLLDAVLMLRERGSELDAQARSDGYPDSPRAKRKKRLAAECYRLANAVDAARVQLVRPVTSLAIQRRNDGGENA